MLRMVFDFLQNPSLEMLSFSWAETAGRASLFYSLYLWQIELGDYEIVLFA